MKLLTMRGKRGTASNRADCFKTVHTTTDDRQLRCEPCIGRKTSERAYLNSSGAVCNMEEACAGVDPSLKYPSTSRTGFVAGSS